MDSQIAIAILFAFFQFGQLKADRGSASTLLIGDFCALWRAGSGIPAAGTIRHAIDDMEIGLLRGREMQ